MNLKHIQEFMDQLTEAKTKEQWKHTVFKHSLIIGDNKHVNVCVQTAAEQVLKRAFEKGLMHKEDHEWASTSDDAHYTFYQWLGTYRSGPQKSDSAIRWNPA